jgi:hypothetical protein
MRATDNQVIWFGPAILPGMVFRTIIEGDIVAGLISCMHCENSLAPGEVVAENRSQTAAVHARCILELAALIPRSEASAADVVEEYNRRRAELSGDQ